MDFWTLPEGEEPLAKPLQTYRQHVQAVLEAHVELWPQTRDYWAHLGTALIQQQLVAEDLSAFLTRVEAGLRLACATHDIGKLNHGFHLYMCAERDNQPVNREWHFRHELLSLPFTWNMARRITQHLGRLPQELPWETLAVMGHHKRLDGNLFERELARGCKPYSPATRGLLAPEQLQHFAWNWVEPFLNAGTQVCRDLPAELWHGLAKIVQAGGARRLIALKDNAREQVQRLEASPQRFLLRWFGASFKAHLQTCDWWASADRHTIYGLGKLPTSPVQPSDPAEIWLQHKLEEIKTATQDGTQVDISWRDFQLQVAALPPQAFCVAPTGSGKTESALLWALNRMQAQPQISKIIYLLPTTTTANAIYKRLSAIFGSHLVGLAHSKARLLREDLKNGVSEEDQGEVRQNVLFETAFFPPVTVATLDQLLLAGLHGKHWSFRNYALAQSTVILDELHAFDPYTLGLFGAFAPQLRLLQVPVLALSATFPRPLRKLFRQWFPDAGEVHDVSLLAASRGRWQFLAEERFDDRLLLQTLAGKMRAGKRLLIVRNTVRGAQATFRALREFKAPVCLLHSAFIQKDRSRIEQAIFAEEEHGGKTSLVATQIIEVSLDIDYDHLISELCPPDALVQRAGRCNRKRTKADATVTVIAADELSHKVYQEQFGVPHILRRSAETLAARLTPPRAMTEQDLLDWVDEVYTGTDLQTMELYQRAHRDFEEQQYRLGYVLDHGTGDDKLETRWTREERVPVVPLSVWLDMSRRQRQRFFARPAVRARYTVEIPYWRRKQLQSQGLALPLELDGAKLEFLYWVDVPYDPIIGLQLTRTQPPDEKRTEIF